MKHLVHSTLFAALVAAVASTSFAFAQPASNDKAATPTTVSTDGKVANAAGIDPAPAAEDKKDCSGCEKKRSAKAPAKKMKTAAERDAEILEFARNTELCKMDSEFVAKHGKNVNVDKYGPWMKACEEYLASHPVSVTMTIESGKSAPLAPPPSPLSTKSGEKTGWFCKYGKTPNDKNDYSEWHAYPFPCADGSTADLKPLSWEVDCDQPDGVVVVGDIEFRDTKDGTEISRKLKCREVYNASLTASDYNQLQFKFDQTNSKSSTWKTVAVVAGVVVGVAVIGTVVYLIVHDRNTHPNVVNETRYVSEALTPRLRFGVAPMKDGAALVLQGSFGN